MHSETSKHSSDMDVDQSQNKPSFATLTNLNKIDESKSEVSQDYNKSQSSNNSCHDSSDDEEVMTKQESIMKIREIMTQLKKKIRTKY